jgi:hypothetical protein
MVNIRMCVSKILHARTEAWWAFFVAVFTGLLLIVAWKQLKFGRVIERAYIVVKPTDDTVRDLAVGKIPWVQLAMDNDGHTPAYHVKGTQLLQVVQYPLPKEAQFKQGPIDANEVTIFPNAPLGMPTMQNHPLTQTELDRINNGIYRACAWGTLTYEDAFNASHYTNFCLCYSASPPSTYCPYHNDAN